MDGDEVLDPNTKHSYPICVSVGRRVGEGTVAYMTFLRPIAEATTPARRREICERVLAAKDSPNNAYLEAERLFTKAQLGALHRLMAQKAKEEYYREGG
jgi:hypothetical protein